MDVTLCISIGEEERGGVHECTCTEICSGPSASDCFDSMGGDGVVVVSGGVSHHTYSYVYY